MDSAIRDWKSGAWRSEQRARASSRPALAAAIVSCDPAFLAALEAALKVANSELSVLLSGETGTGKELIARAIHEYSPRSSGPFIAVNSAAIPDTLLESELFGHERGAFTGAERRRIGRFERASGGTLFLDEIGDMAPTLQAKILRVLEAREIERLGAEEAIPLDVRVIAATNRALKVGGNGGTLREELYHRLAGAVITLPPLRERPEDVPLLARYYLAHYASRYGIEAGSKCGPTCPGCADCWLTSEACALLRAHSWPGNVRELRHAMERAAVLAQDERITPAHLPPEIVRGEPNHVRPDGAERATDRPLTLRENERRHIERTLKLTRGNRSRAADLLGIHRNTLRAKLREHGLR